MGRRVRIFPHRASCVRLIAMVLEEIHEDWLTAEKAYLTFEHESNEEGAVGKVVSMAANQ